MNSLAADCSDLPDFEEEPDYMEMDDEPSFDEAVLNVSIETIDHLESKQEQQQQHGLTVPRENAFQRSEKASMPPRRKPMNPKELAKLMQADRMASMGVGEGRSTDGGGSSKSCNASEIINMQLDAVSSLITRQPLFYKIDATILSSFTHSRPPSNMQQHYTTCVLSNGDRVFVYNAEQDTTHHSFVIESGLESLGSGCLLGKSIDLLMKEVDAMKVKKLLDEENKSTHDNSLNDDDISNDDHSSVDTINTSTADLWVDKYSPKSFTQLLSPEKINREVLKSLKKWDNFVFKTPSNNGNDEDTRPLHKVILLCGPPGTGKTTLAHIVAKHCGYRPMEINASDDRSPEVLRDRISRATLNRTMDMDQRPNCIILDEIDGIDGSRNALDCLTSIIKAPLHGNNKGEGNRKSKSFPLTRPMICICNDQFAPALRELRRLAEIFVFSAPKEVRLVQRLKQVCISEGLQMSNGGAITELCTATGYDIRSSINNLQFAALKSLREMKESQKQKLRNERDGSSSPTAGKGEGSHKKPDISFTVKRMIRNGMKDDNLDLHQVWKQILTTEDMIMNHYNSIQQRLFEENHSSSIRNQGNDKSCMRALDVMKNFGDCYQVIGGIWENIHKLDLQSPNFNRNTIAADAISTADMLHSFTFQANDGFQVMPYISLVAAEVRCYCATSRRNIRIEWPNKDRDMFYKNQQKRNILRLLHDTATNSSPLMRSSQQQLVLDVISPILEILHPRVRSLPMITLSPPEQNAVMAVVSVMESIGLCYAPVKEIDTRYDFYSKGLQQHKNPSSKPSFGEDVTKSGSFTHGVKTTMQLEPAINLLVQYDTEPLPEELIAHHHEIHNDLRHILFTEQKKYSVKLKIAQSTSDYHTLTKENDASEISSSSKKRNMGIVKDDIEQKSKKFLIENNVSTSSKESISTEANESKPKKRQRTGGLHSFFKRME